MVAQVTQALHGDGRLIVSYKSWVTSFKVSTAVQWIRLNHLHRTFAFNFLLHPNTFYVFKYILPSTSRRISTYVSGLGAFSLNSSPFKTISSDSRTICLETLWPTECRKRTAVLLSIIYKMLCQITGYYFISNQRVLKVIYCRLCRTYMTVQRQFARKLHAGEDDEGEFLLELVKYNILVASCWISSCTLRCGCGQQICKVPDHEPGGDNYSHKGTAKPISYWVWQGKANTLLLLTFEVIQWHGIQPVDQVLVL